MTTMVALVGLNNWSEASEASLTPIRYAHIQHLPCRAFTLKGKQKSEVAQILTESVKGRAKKLMHTCSKWQAMATCVRTTT